VTSLQWRANGRADTLAMQRTASIATEGVTGGAEGGTYISTIGEGGLWNLDNPNT